MPDTKLEIAGEISKKFLASHRKRQRESSHNVSTAGQFPISVGNLRHAGFARFLAQLYEQILEFAVQPDSWGERTRARLISEVFAGLKGVQPKMRVWRKSRSSQMLWCPVSFSNWDAEGGTFEIEFPANPCDSAARFGLRTGPSYPIHSINSEQLVRLVAEAGEELVGLCYFGDQQSRENIEAQLALEGATPDS